MTMLELAPPGAEPCRVEPSTALRPPVPVPTVLTLDATVEAIAVGRHWATRAARLNGMSEPASDVVELLASELLTNAVRHGPVHGDITVRVERRPGFLRVTVRDDGSGSPAVRAAGPRDESGRGLTIVDRLAAAWGVQHDLFGGTSVWFETALAMPTRIPTQR